MTCPERYDLLITDGQGESHGLVCEWARGGAGLRVEAPSSLDSTAVSTKGDYGVRDAKDAFRIVQSDWSEGAGQKSYDRDQDSESAFWESKSIDVSTIGTMRLGPSLTRTTDVNALPYIFAALTDSGTPLVFRAVNGSPYIKYSSDGTTWSSVTGTVGDEVRCFATDGQYVYAVRVDSGAIHRGVKTGWATHSSDGSNAGFTHVAFCSGVLYAAKGTSGTTAQLGAFSGASPDVWTELSPDAGKNINASGETFGLVAVGNYVYWGVTNGMVTKVYRGLQGGGAVKDELAEVCSFPTGFVGASMYSYLNTVYVGGHFDAATVNTGIGAIYAIINDSPALLTEVGDDKTKDNRVLSMSAYERNLFFISNSQLWRWDLKYGGYSQWAGPLNSTAVNPYSALTWIGTWDMAAAPGTGAEPDATISTSGGATISYDGAATATIASRLDQNSYVSIAALANSAPGGTSLINDTTGTTVEVDLPANALSRWDGGVRGGAIHFGVNGSVKSAWVRLVLDPLDGYTYVHADLYSGNTRTTDDTLIASSNGWLATADDVTEQTVRLTLKSGEANVYLYSASQGTTKKLCSGRVNTDASPVKTVFLKFMRSVEQGVVQQWYPGPQYAMVNRMRWCDDGVYEPDIPTAVSSVGLACSRDSVWASCSGYGVAVTGATTYYAPGTDENPASLTFSQTSGNMPTVDKYFQAFHVQLENELPASCSLVATGFIDGKTFQTAEDSDLSTETLKVFRIGIGGRSIQPVLTIVSTDDEAGAGVSSSVTPVVTDTAVLFTPMPKTARMHTYYIRCWEKAESRTSGSKWDERANDIADWLETLANTIVTVERPSRDAYQGKIEGLEYIEAPPSRKANGREGLYQLIVRQVS